ncbi:Crp/Fnr family transcriptional regulator [Georgenia thermotolerans]|uniref:Helix-turn-helix domain-containing protein n=1 Tax=Georgenia thermotolerans TaxID=527326 RepID=A0A7J5UNW2_9MICO|nr:Crp/Fnr family transcriptional regulator [Georgenia thermotolerans]KAE8764088.1 helix-turn-helix domain-containing protein [Georgenia thermotolerans]
MNAEPRTTARRRAPLRATCAQPHACPRPVRMRVLSQVGYFAGLTEAELADIDRRMVALSWAEDDPLYRAGEPADHLYVLAAGRVKITQPTATGAELITDLLAPGDLFGALSTLGEPTYPESAVALTTTCALRIDPGAFRAVLTAHPQVALRVLDDVAARLARARSDAGRVASGSVAQRLAATLLRLATKLGQERAGDGTTLLQLPLTRADLAAMTASTPESVSRLMSRWRAEGVIDSGRRWTAIRDRERLEEIAAG